MINCNNNIVKGVDISDFQCYAIGHCSISRYKPDKISIRQTLLTVDTKIYDLEKVIIIARYRWLLSRKLFLPDDLEVPNLCLMINNKKLIRAFYSETLTHIIKKIKYYVFILN